jgi:S1-C subfamily serine protease
MTARAVTVCAAAAALLFGCAPRQTGGVSVADATAYPGLTSVRFNNEVMSPSAALDASSRADAAIIAQIPPAPHPIAASVRIVVPDHDRVRPLIVQLTRPPTPGVVEFGSERLRQELHDFGELVEHSGLFEHVTIVEQNDTVAPDPAGAEYLMWYQVRSTTPNNGGPWIGHWLMKRAGSAAVQPVNMDLGTPAGVARWNSFLTGIRYAADRLGNTSATATAGNGVRRAVSGGSGIVVDAQGHVLTNNHVVAGCPELHVVDANRGEVTATLVNGDATNDLALLRTDRRYPSWARFSDGHGLRPGEPVVATGFPLSGLVSSEMAVTTGSVTALAGFRGDTRQLEFSAPIQQGNSGGPVLDESGRVVGVTVSMLNGLALAAATGALPENVNFAIKAATAREFLDANQVALDAGAGRPGMNPAEVGELARGFTVKVECWR